MKYVAIKSECKKRMERRKEKETRGTAGEAAREEYIETKTRTDRRRQGWRAGRKESEAGGTDEHQHKNRSSL